MLIKKVIRRKLIDARIFLYKLFFKYVNIVIKKSYVVCIHFIMLINIEYVRQILFR